MAARCGIVGIGQTKHDSKRLDVSMVGLVREAALRALEDAELTWKDIDAVVIGKAPDLFDRIGSELEWGGRVHGDQIERLRIRLRHVIIQFSILLSSGTFGTATGGGCGFCFLYGKFRHHSERCTYIINSTK